MAELKRIVSISLGSSKRDHAVEAEFLGQRFSIERIGTDGDVEKAISMIREMDGKVDAFGMGGIDLYIYAGNKRYIFRDAKKIALAAKKTPIVDGSGLKNTLERRVIRHLVREEGITFSGRKVLVVSGADRFGMAEALVEAGADAAFGDLVFSLGLPVMLRSLRALYIAARLLAPIIVRLPFTMLYPTGDKQEKVVPKYARYYHEAEVIAGDFLFIRRHLPEKLNGQTIITNTVTMEDIELLRQRGAGMLITTTPELEGRSFGTNVMEGMLLALSDKAADQVTPDDYNRLLDQIGIKPRIVRLTDQPA
ncbi:MAG: quinate 5-dehydrogenase [Firmicutes bacterium]|nr:quinate 5-dehydrogenase [Bacillota bacterium]